MKRFWQSKTFWANAAVLVAAVVQFLLSEAIIPVEQQAGIVAIINLVLRFVTKEPVSVYGKPKADIISDPLDTRKLGT